VAKPLITELTTKEGPARYFPEREGGASEVAELIPEPQHRTSAPSIAALDEATLRNHFADLAAPGGPSWPGSALAARAASLPGLTCFHPRQPLATVQGLLEIGHEVARALTAATGLDRFTLQPPTLAAAGRAALLVARAAFERTEPGRTEVVVPAESPALGIAQDLGLPVRSVARLSSGDIDLDSLVGVVGQSTAAVVASWRTATGAFERNLAAAGEVAHAHGALFCVDATGLATLVGRTRLREAGVDIAWLSLRELCPLASSAALGVRTPLTEFLPGPLIGKAREGYELDDELPRTVGPLALSPANLLDALNVYVTLLRLGESGLRARAERLALEANTHRCRLLTYYENLFWSIG